MPPKKITPLTSSSSSSSSVSSNTSSVSSSSSSLMLSTTSNEVENNSDDDNDEIKHDDGNSSPSTTNNTNNNINSTCSISYQELRYEKNLLPEGNCTWCNTQVLRHQRDNNYVSPQNNNNNSNNNNISNTNNINTPSVNTSQRPTSISELTKLVSILPKWNKKTVCRTFLQRVQQLLSSSGIPDTEWIRVFPFIVDDISSCDWISKNIIDKKLKWSDACTAFTSHFQIADYRLTLQQQYSNCKQLSNESVQSYSDRFVDICTQLSIDDNNDLAIQQFINHLQSSMHKQFYSTLAIFRINCDDQNFMFDSLKKIINVCISLDVANRTSNIAHENQSSQNSSSSRNSASDSKKSCKYHPNATSHSTSECRSSEAKAAAQSKGTKQPQINIPSVKTEIICNSCKAPGHKANDASCPKYYLRTPQANQSSSQMSSSTSKSPFANLPPHRTPSSNSNTSSSSSSSSSSSNINPSVRSTTIQNNSIPDSDDPFENISNKLVSIPPESANTNNNINNSILTATIPSELFTPASYTVLFIFKGKVYNTLLDSGANRSIIDYDLAKELNIKIVNQPGSITLGEKGSSATRIGFTESIKVDAIFPCPKYELKMKSVTLPFELMRLDTSSYHFIIGQALIHQFFPNGIPLEYIPCPTDSSLIRLCTFVQKESDISIDIIPPSVLPLAEAECYINGLNKLNDDIQDTGAGTKLPPDEVPIRMSLFTSSELEPEYSVQREIILRDPEIQQALRINESIIGFCNLPESVIDIQIDPEKESKLYRRQYPIPQAVMSLTQSCIDRWLEEGKIGLAPPNCPYNNPITIAPKKDENGELTAIRICLDTRAINSGLINSDKFQLPPIRQSLNKFTGAKIFAEVDLREAYLQFLVAEPSRKYLAFSFGGKQYVFIGCPYGLAHIPSLFQRNMSIGFGNVPFAFPYLDNIPIGSKNWDDHRQHVLFIILRLNELNLKIKPSSIKIGQSHMKCLGHTLSLNGVSIDDGKITLIKSWPRPVTGSQLATFLGFIVFCRDHIRHAADITGPLESVKTFDNKIIEWTPALIECFETTKLAVSLAPVLRFPDYTRPFYIATDASNTGVGGVLYQPADLTDDITSSNMVAICSKKLSPSQQNYSPYKKELFGIVYCLRQFHIYVWGRNDLVIFTDHKPLTHMLSSTTLAPALQLWLDVVLDYSFIIKHRPGILNVIPDALSRMYTSLYPKTWGVPDADATCSPFRLLGGEGITVSTVNTEQDDMAEVDDEKGSVDDTSDIDDEKGSVDSDLSINSDLLIELEKRGKISPPIAERLEMISKEHEFGHFGRDAIYKKLFMKGYWWEKMRDDIQLVLQNCDACMKFVVTKSGYHPASYITSSGPWEHIQIDTSIHLPASPDGYVALLVVICIFTGFVILRPLKSHNAETVSRKLWKIFCLFGLPKIIQSDSGPEFCNDVIRALVKIVGIIHRFITPYNPRCDGKVERSIGTVMSIIKKLLHGSDNHWPLFVPFAQLAFNNKIASLTNSTAFSLMFGRQLNEIKDYSNSECELISLEDWQAHQEKIISLIYPAIEDRIRINKESMIKSLDRNRRLLSHDSIPAGSTVMLRDPARQNKFEPKYIGPYIVARRSHNGQYVLRDVAGDILDRHVTSDQLKLVSRKKRAKDASTYYMSKVLSHRGDAGSYEYLVQWYGYNIDQSTWEPQANFNDVKLIQNYWKDLNKQQVAPSSVPTAISETVPPPLHLLPPGITSV